MGRQPQYIFSTPEHLLNLEFYESYDPDFLFSKVRSLLFPVLNRELFEKTVGENFGKIDDKFYQSLRAEIYFAQFHHFEALLALILAAFQDLPHWVYLTTYPTEEIKTAAQRLVERNFSELSRGKVSNEADFMNAAIYTYIQPSDPEIRARWETNRKNILILLCQLAERYLDALEYNSYKHGLRIHTGAFQLAIAPDDQPDKAFLLDSSDNSISFLESKKESKDVYRLYRTTKTFDLKHAVNNLSAMQILTQQIRNTRLAVLSGKQDIDISTFSFDMQEFYDSAAYTRWSVSL